MKRRVCNSAEGAAVIALLFMVALAPSMSFVTKTSFLIRPPSPAFLPSPSSSTLPRQKHVRLQLNFDSNDPFDILGMDEPTTDQKVIKRAYKRMALKYHPDVLSTKDSTPEGKKQASDRFAKINWAYSTLSGKLKDDQTYQSKSSGSSSSASAGGGWTPPHRRSGRTYSSSSSSNTDTTKGVSWEDFMPRQEETSYDTDGDSFGKIFSDLFTSTAVGAATGSSGSVFKDFIEFLEGNVDGYGGGGDNDADLRILLNTGSREEVRNEMDDTELVVNQLKTKLDGIDLDITSVTGEMNVSIKYLDKIKLEENLDELKARKNVVSGYMKKAQKRLLKLQTRYQEMISRTSSYTDSSYGSGTSRQATWDEIKKETTQSSRSSSSTSSASTSASTSTYTSSNQDTSRDSEDSWKKEGFGSSGRGRGRGGRRRATAEQSKTSSQRDSVYTSTSSGQSSRTSSSSTHQDTHKEGQNSRNKEGFGSSGRGRGSRQRTSESSSDSGGQNVNREPNISSRDGSGTFSSGERKTSFSSSNIPPHRRTSSSSSRDQDKKRLQEIKVDEEFEKLKKELGL